MTGTKRYVTLPRAERDGLIALLESMRPGTAPSATGWGQSRRAVLLALRDVTRALDEDLALRVDRLIRQGRRSTLGALSPEAYAASRERLGAFLDDALDEIAVRPRVHDLIAGAA